VPKNEKQSHRSGSDLRGQGLFLTMAASAETAGAVPLKSWRDAGKRAHFVQFYDEDRVLVDSVRGFTRRGLETGAGAIVIATPSHREAIERAWRDDGFDPTPWRATGQLRELDAAATLQTFMVRNRPDASRFRATVGAEIARSHSEHGHVVAFGEMVALLWGQGHQGAAIQLEELWNELAKEHSFALFCAYPRAQFHGDAHAVPYHGVCSQHTGILTYDELAEKTAALEREIEARKRIEMALAAREQELRDETNALQVEIAERKRVEHALRESDRRKDEFLAILAHELRNPLAPIRYAIAIAGQQHRTPEQRRWADELVERQVGHMARLLDDLLDVSRITRGKLELRKARVDLTSPIATAIETARPLIEGKKHVLAIDLPKAAVRLDADPVRLAQVFSNLLTNAAKYTDTGGRIEVRAWAEGAHAVVAVRDSGIGIAPEMLPRLFTLFAQAKSALDRSEGGLGIGLALVRGIVSLHGGTIEARSDGVGHGSEFLVRVPLGTGAPADLPFLASAEATGGTVERLRVVVADDNRDSAESCAAYLQICGHEVHIACTGREALRLIERLRPQVAVLDIGLPDFNGYTLAERIRAEPWGRDPVLIAVTGWGQHEDRQRAFAAGFDHHLTKPVSPGSLERLLRREGEASESQSQTK
jgi:signal transduction histidine kinase/CheY-like chemotaxis protein